MKASDVRKGTVLLIDGAPCRVLDFQHRTPGNLRAFVQVRLRNLKTGNTFDTRLGATDVVDDVRLDTKEFQVMYRDDHGTHVMDSATYDQFYISDDVAGDAAQWLEPEMHFQAELMDGQVVGIQLPASMEYTIVETAPVMRGATKTASTKPARLNNGLTINVPEFLEEGTRVRVDPRSGTYLERAK
ncbi:MAG TPA: elongation factor P [Gemmatimonadales bacterium]|nr:elongation factor P [Gemmatimonadales bacterium]